VKTFGDENSYRCLIFFICDLCRTSYIPQWRGPRAIDFPPNRLM
jgi:hypothetical protein